MVKHGKNLIALLGLTLAAPGALAADGFFSQYNLGFSYAASTSYATVSYDAPQVANLPKDCVADNAQPGKMRCAAYLAPDNSTGASAFSVYLEKPFVRQGWFYFQPGFTFTTVSYTGGLAPKPVPSAQNGGSGNSKASSTTSGGNSGMTGAGAANPPTTQPGASSGSTTNASASSTDPQAQPLTKAYVDFYGLDLQAYLRLGFTPLYFPDIMLSVGLGMQAVGGTIKLFTAKETRFVAQPEAFGELELVLIRGYTGALSIFYGFDQSLDTTLNSKLIGDNPGGSNLTSFNLGLNSGSAGVRVLFPF